jgi:hypothetical protein
MHGLLIGWDFMHRNSFFFIEIRFYSFSLASYDITKESDSHIVLLIRHMTNLKELSLSIIVYQRSTFIDGIRLQNEMLIFICHNFKY